MSFSFVTVVTAEGTPDGLPPPMESVCDAETGAAYGLCNAYCQAMDCDSDTPSASETACQKVADKYEQIAGWPVPCSETCPMYQNPNFPYFNALVSRSSPITSCTTGWTLDDPDSLIACSGVVGDCGPFVGDTWAGIWHGAISAVGQDGDGVDIPEPGLRLDYPDPDPMDPTKEFDSCKALLVNAGAVNCAAGPYAP